MTPIDCLKGLNLRELKNFVIGIRISLGCVKNTNPGTKRVKNPILECSFSKPGNGDYSYFLVMY